jgi:hypothetical protein
MVVFGIGTNWGVPQVRAGARYCALLPILAPGFSPFYRHKKPSLQAYSRLCELFINKNNDMVQLGRAPHVYLESVWQSMVLFGGC